MKDELRWGVTLLRFWICDFISNQNVSMKKIASLLISLISITLIAQETMNDYYPYSAIPEAPEKYTAGTVVSRMIDGLGFRYYWATEGLREKDLDYKPSNEGRTIAETSTHIYNLSLTILNSAKKLPNDRTVSQRKPVSEDLRKLALLNLQEASTLFMEAKDLSEHSVIFISAKGVSEFPFWNNINGPIEDAIWHAGQIVVMRRSAGNPINPKVNVFLGRLND